MKPFNPYIYILFSIAFLSFSCGSNVKEEDHDDDHHEGGIVLSPEKAEEFGIEYETVVPSIFHDVIKTSGSIEASGADIFNVSAKRNGIVKLAPGITRGTSVKSGERIATISSEGVQGGDISQAASSNLEAAKAEYERLKPLYEDGLVTASAFREAERIYKEASAIAGKGAGGGAVSVTAPTNGAILNLEVKSGDYVDVGTPIATIGKNTSQILKVDLPVRHSVHLGEIETANFRPEGSEEVMRLTDLNGKKISGSGNVGASNGYIPVYFSFQGNIFTSSGGFAEVFLICGEKNDVISVPREALIEIQGNKYVYVMDDDGDYEKRLVKTGLSDGERIEIQDGLEEGEKVVSKGASVIRMAEVSAVAPPAHTHNH